MSTLYDDVVNATRRARWKQKEAAEKAKKAAAEEVERQQREIEAKLQERLKGEVGGVVSLIKEKAETGEDRCAFILFSAEGPMLIPDDVICLSGLIQKRLRKEGFDVLVKREDGVAPVDSDRHRYSRLVLFISWSADGDVQ